MPTASPPTIQQLILQPLEIAPSPPLPLNNAARLEIIQQNLERHAREIRAKIHLSAAYTLAHAPPDPSTPFPAHQDEPSPSAFQTALRSVHDPRAPPPSLPDPHSRPDHHNLHQQRYSHSEPSPATNPNLKRRRSNNERGGPTNDERIANHRPTPPSPPPPKNKQQYLSHQVLTSLTLAQTLDDYNSCIQPLIERVKAQRAEEERNKRRRQRRGEEEVGDEEEDELFVPWVGDDDDDGGGGMDVEVEMGTRVEMDVEAGKGKGVRIKREEEEEEGWGPLSGRRFGPGVVGVRGGSGDGSGNGNEIRPDLDPRRRGR